jgi:hypothetical protein
MISETIKSNQTMEMPVGGAKILRLRCPSGSARFENHGEGNVNSRLDDGLIGREYLTADLNLRQA